MKTSFFIYLVFILLSCSEKKQEKAANNIRDTSPDNIDTLTKGSPNIDTVKNTSVAPATDSIIIAKFLKDSIATTITGILKEAPQNVKIYVDVKQGKTLSAMLHTKDAGANIRINQFITPDGKADGPFANEITRPLSKRGRYTLIIGHNLMAEGGSSVKFELRLIVK